ncbi:MAG TPA: NAD(P)-dependent oxidoreductase [Gemmatimonadaceae bacterium]
MKIAFVGIGHMGSGMASRLIAAGHTLTVYNRTRSRAEPLGKLGARVVDSVRDAVTGAEVLITMLADDHAVEEVIFLPGDALHALTEGATHISMSTISVDLSRRLAAVHRDNGQHYLVATVFGRPDVAAAGKLYVVAAGDAEQVRRYQPLFEAMGQKVFNAGSDAPSSNVIKLAGNFMITTVIECLAECIALARKSDVDPHVMLDVLTGSLFSAPIYKTYADIVVDEKFEPAAFKLPLGLKDNTLVLQAAQSANVPMPMASLVHDRFVTAMATGLGESDWSAIARVAYQSAGL